MFFGVELYSDSEEDDSSYAKVERRNLRDKSNILDMPESEFIKNFRLNKEAFQFVLNKVQLNMKQTYRSNAIPPYLKLASCLRFLAEGSYQRGVGNDFMACFAQPTVSLALSECLNAIEESICPEWIQLKMTEAEEISAKAYFFSKCGIPGIVGCVDGTHIRIVAPAISQRHLFYNRKGFYSINAMVVCDHNMYIRYIDARHPGANHDSFVWNGSNADRFFNSMYNGGKENTWLLGDSGYPLLPYLITPFRNAANGSLQMAFNDKHSKGRSIIERTIGLLKNRFRCIIGERGLHYAPSKVTQIINVSCALHNICRFYKIENVDIETFLQEQSNDEEPAEQHTENDTGANNLSRVATSIRNQLI